MLPTHNSSRFKSQGVDRSWTDAVTNAVMLYGMDNINYIKWFHNRDARINSVIPQFLHEYTHFWCFDSLVGSTLSLLRIRARLRCVFSYGSDNELQIGEDLYSYLTAKYMLKPIAEGLALFSEFDLTPGGSEMLTMISHALFWVFGFLLVEDDAKKLQNYVILALLQNTRFNQEFLYRRKARIYFQPFDCDKAYLPGYLTIKTLYNFLRQRIREFEDREVFLAYLRSFFYNDATLVKILIDENIFEIKKAKAITNHIDSRFLWLITELTETDVQDFIRFTLDGGYGPYVKGIGVDEKTATEALEKLTFLYQSLKEYGCALRDNETAFYTIGAALSAFETRGFIVIAGTQVKVDVDEYGKPTLTSDTDKEIKISFEVKSDFEKKGEYLIVMSLASKSIIEVLSQQSGAVILSTTGSLSENEKEKLKIFITTRRLSQDLLEILEENLNKWIEESYVKIVLDNITTNLNELATDIYLAISTLSVKNSDLKDVKKQLLEKGFTPFINEDFDIACTLGAIGLMNTLSLKRYIINIFLRGKFGIDEDIFMRAINYLLKQKQYPLILGTEENLQALY